MLLQSRLVTHPCDGSYSLRSCVSFKRRPRKINKTTKAIKSIDIKEKENTNRNKKKKAFNDNTVEEQLYLLARAPSYSPTLGSGFLCEDAPWLNLYVMCSNVLKH
jgi:hypothetical protein